MMVKFTCAASIMDKRTTENIRLTVALANTEYVVSLASMGDNVAFVFVFFQDIYIIISVMLVIVFSGCPSLLEYAITTSFVC